MGKNLPKKVPVNLRLTAYELNKSKKLAKKADLKLTEYIEKVLQAGNGYYEKKLGCPLCSK